METPRLDLFEAEKRARIRRSSPPTPMPLNVEHASVGLSYEPSNLSYLLDLRKTSKHRSTWTICFSNRPFQSGEIFLFASAPPPPLSASASGSDGGWKKGPHPIHQNPPDPQ